MSPLDQPTGLLPTLRAGVVARLTTDPETDPNQIPVLDGGRMDIAQSVTQALTKRTAGLCLVVTVPKLDADDSATNAVRVTVTVQIYERPVINWSEKGRRQSIEDTFEWIYSQLCFQDNGATGWTPSDTWHRFQLSGFRLIYSDTNQVVAEANFITGTVIKAEVTESLPSEN